VAWRAGFWGGGCRAVRRLTDRPRATSVGPWQLRAGEQTSLGVVIASGAILNVQARLTPCHPKMKRAALGFAHSPINSGPRRGRNSLMDAIVGDVLGRVEAIYTAPAEALPVVRRERALARPGEGLSGDRYASRTGHWSGDRRVSRDLTLVEAEAIDALSAALGAEIEPGELRRNVVTSGVRLNDLVGVRFWVGDVLAEGTGLCEPCSHLERVTGKSVLRPLVHRGGLRANVLSVGEIAQGVSLNLDVPRVGVGVVVKRAGRYLLGLRRSSRGGGTWSTPGGEVLPAESIGDCALRELHEETDLVGVRPRVVAQSANWLDDGREWHSMFVAVDVPGSSEPQIREPEKCAGWGWFEPRELPEPLFTPVAAVLR
jgi:MOSC domain-containing protein YiiM